MRYTIKKYLLIFFIGILSISRAFAETTLNSLPPAKLPISYPSDQQLYDRYPWSLMYYFGITENNVLLQVLAFHNLRRWPEYIQSLEAARTLDENNPIRRFFNPIVGIVEVAGNLTIRNGRDENMIYEFDPYLIFRWANLPWNNHVNTSFAIGEGVSYVTAVPAIEKHDNDNTKRLLNYLMFEATFADPDYPRLQFVARVHHRSGAYGLYGAGNSGSNDIGVGVRYLFD
jgi:hypothetical protein